MSLFEVIMEILIFFGIFLICIWITSRNIDLIKSKIVLFRNDINQLQKKIIQL